MTPRTVIDYVRRLAQDAGLLRTPDSYRDATLLVFVNQTFRAMATVRPDLFATIAAVPTVANTVVQTMPEDSIRLIDILYVEQGSAITEVSKDTLDRSTPNWVSDAAGEPVNFCRNVRNPNKYFLYPRPSAGVSVVAEYAKAPIEYGLDDTVELLPDSYTATVAMGTLALLMLVDNSKSQPSDLTAYKEHQAKFEQMLGLSLQARVLTDTNPAGLDPKEVI